MKKLAKKKLIILASVVALIGFGALVVNNYKTKTSFKYSNKSAEDLKPQQNPQDPVNSAIIEDAKAQDELRKNSELLKILPEDYVIGDKNAPVIMIEYASLSCPHCATFVRESYEKLKNEYFDSGKVAFIFRNFPLNHPALAGAMLAECQAQDNPQNSAEKYYSVIKILFRTQDSWAFDQKFIEKLESIFKLDGMSSERFSACVNNKSLQEKILKHRMEVAKSLFIKSTPSFFVNGEASEGYIDYVTLKKLIDKKLEESKK
ncbi:MAG: DsbA family protein [Proteobacteria bacterium]|nr:DsbA family protein [Pseudomonadota bacterium]NCA27971.1 DsbA family protein [Pseudomonadota bacterium]